MSPEATNVPPATSGPPIFGEEFAGRRSAGTSVIADRNFLALWAGETVSLTGTEMAELALMLTAVVSLGVSPLQAGLLVTARFVPYAGLSLFAGVWFDRHRKRPTLIAASAGRAIFIGLVPLSYLLGCLSIGVVYLAAAGLGLMSVVFDVGSQSYLPDLVGREHLVEANGKLQISYAIAGISGPGIAGVVVSILTAPITLCLNVATYLISALSLMFIKHQEMVPAASDREPIWLAIRVGLRAVVADSVLLNLATQSAVFNLFENLLLAILPLYLLRDLGLASSTLGLVLGLIAVGGLVGAAGTARITARLGARRALRLSTVGACLAPLFFLAARDSGPVSLAVLIGAGAVHGAALAVFNVNAISLRQTVTPPEILGRMNASYRLLLFLTVPIGAMVGGVVADLLSLSVAVAVGVVGLTVPLLWLLFSPALRTGEAP